MPHILVIIIIGAIAGWIAGALVNSDSNSILAGYRYRYCGWIHRYKAVWHQAGHHLQHLCERGDHSGCRRRYSCPGH